MLVTFFHLNAGNNRMKITTKTETIIDATREQPTVDHHDYGQFKGCVSIVFGKHNSNDVTRLYLRVAEASRLAKALRENCDKAIRNVLIDIHEDNPELLTEIVSESDE